jgi:hypothetical protein
MRFVILTFGTLALCVVRAQVGGSPTLSGSIDGRVIPDRVLNIPRETLVSTFIREHSKEPATMEDQHEMQATRARLV